jgi:ABC-type phosphate/phosphonate transport system substrate-binding protein
LTCLAGAGLAAYGQQGKLDVLRIGTSGTLAAEKGGPKETAALDTLKVFIKDETGLDNEILRYKDWQELTDKLAKQKAQLGVFQGYEFAWAQEKLPGLHPLAVAVNVYLYPVAYVVARKDSQAADFAGLQGQSLALPGTGQRYLELFVERQAQARGKDLHTFFSKLVTKDNAEDALDDVVDGTEQAAVAERAALEAYKRRKPGRFAQLKEVAHSQAFPPAVVAYYDKALDEDTLGRFRKGLLDASRTEKGQMMLTMFRLTGFQAVPQDFQQVLTRTRKEYPPSAPGKK